MDPRKLSEYFESQYNTEAAVALKYFITCAKFDLLYLY